MRRRLILGATAAALLAAGLAPTAASAARPRFSARVTNPYFPLRPGSRWVYRGAKDGHAGREVVVVAHRTTRIAGVPCAIVHDRVYLAGRLAERTSDWYSQDRHGTVWYLGEATAELDRHGRVTSTEGSWRSGRDGARGGVFMPAHPHVGRSFAQERFPGHAEDHFRILSRRATITVPFGAFRRRAMTTREWTPLEPGVIDRKWYARGIGEIAEATIKGGSERWRLVAFHRG